jgi:hypothetical protein
MGDMPKDVTVLSPAALPEYEPPRITIMKDEEVLKAFQMTAVEISAAGCWWMPGGGSR